MKLDDMTEAHWRAARRREQLDAVIVWSVFTTIAAAALTGVYTWTAALLRWI